MMKRHRVALAAIVVIAGVGWFGLREYNCKLRGAALSRQVESIKRDAAEELTIGTNKAEVARFFAQRNIPFAMLESEAYGSFRTSGCAPLGCGTDTRFIGLRGNLKGGGTDPKRQRVLGCH